MLQEEEDEGCCSTSPDVELSPPFVTHTETNRRVNKDERNARRRRARHRITARDFSPTLDAGCCG